MKTKCLLLSLAIATSQLLALNPRAAAEEKPSAAFRKEHVEIKKHLTHIEEMSAKLRTQPRARQRKQMETIAEFFRQHIVPHAEWEEKILYPAVDKRAATGANPFTSTMRYDHRVVGRWVKDLSARASRQDSNAGDFAQLTDKLLGLLAAHFEKEEEVLLPILDRTMSKAEFEREIMPRGPAGNHH